MDTRLDLPQFGRHPGYVASKEQCLYLHRFQTLEEARDVIATFITRYNHEWLIERLGDRTPAQARTQGWRAAA